MARLAYAASMKVELPIPDALFREAEKAARRLRMPRSRFYSQAIERMLRDLDVEETTRLLDEVYGAGAPGIDPAFRRAVRKALRPKQRGEW